MILIAFGGSYQVVPDLVPEQLALLCNASLKVGVVLSLAWLAWPQLAAIAEVLPAWLVVLTIVSGLAIIVRPQIAIYVMPIYLTLVTLQFGGHVTRWLRGETGQPDPPSRSDPSPPSRDPRA